MKNKDLLKKVLNILSDDLMVYRSSCARCNEEKSDFSFAMSYFSRVDFVHDLQLINDSVYERLMLLIDNDFLPFMWAISDYLDLWKMERKTKYCDCFACDNLDTNKNGFCCMVQGKNATKECDCDAFTPIIKGV